MEEALLAVEPVALARVFARYLSERAELLRSLGRGPASAAAYERLDVTSFIMRNVLPAARDVVDRAERIVLSERDTVRVLELLENPPKPTPALMARSPSTRRTTKRRAGMSASALCLCWTTRSSSSFRSASLQTR